jgi:Tfp pilus assembly protein PilP
MAKNSHGGLKVLGLAAVAAAAAGAYFFYGPGGSKNRRNLKSWMVKARAEVMENVENLKDVSEKSYDQVVDKVIAKYKKVKSIAPNELAAVQKELKSSWKAVKSEVDKAAKKVRS